MEISIHPPRVGRDQGTRNCRGGRVISIHPPRVGRDLAKKFFPEYDSISIHPPRVGRDQGTRNCRGGRVISIHPPRVGRDTTPAISAMQSSIFQSTLPVWGGTETTWKELRDDIISIHPPRVGRDVHPSTDLNRFDISIHPPRVGRDGLRRRNCGRCIRISIHPPRVGRDYLRIRIEREPSDFNPPSPCGEGLARRYRERGRVFISIHPPRVGRDDRFGWGGVGCGVFQSTLPVWGGTLIGASQGDVSSFQSTLPVWGGTRRFLLLFCFFGNFNPPSPCGEGRIFFLTQLKAPQFQSTLPVWGGTSFFVPPSVFFVFQSTLPVWGGTVIPGIIHHIQQRISIHPPRVGRDSKSSQKFFVNFCARR